jgi:hypothetical protein
VAAVQGTGVPQQENKPPQGVESKPLRDSVPDYSIAAQEAQVQRLQELLRGYRDEQAQAILTQPTAEEMIQREQASRDVAILSPIPFSPDKVRLNGAEGSQALVEITRRLSNPDMPESRRDYAPICSFRTYLYGSLIADEKRSFKAVGKHHFVLKQHLQPGNTTVSISGHSWDVRLPDDSHSQEYLITLYKPPGVKPQFHVFPVAELVATEDAHIPAWLPEELQISRPG